MGLVAALDTIYEVVGEGGGGESTSFRDWSLTTGRAFSRYMVEREGLQNGRAGGGGGAVSDVLPLQKEGQTKF